MLHQTDRNQDDVKKTWEVPLLPLHEDVDRQTTTGYEHRKEMETRSFWFNTLQFEVQLAALNKL
jgi:hypothetical protein